MTDKPALVLCGGLLAAAFAYPASPAADMAQCAVSVIIVVAMARKMR